MQSVLFSLIPVFLIILLGFLLKRSSIFDEAAWRGLENLCYYVLFPVLLVKTLATAQMGSSEVIQYVAALLFTVLGMSSLLLLSYPLLKRSAVVSPAAFTSIFQGTIRWHGFVALSIVGLLLGDQGVSYIAIAMGVIIPPINILCVSVLARMGSGKHDLAAVLRKLARNPFIIACAVGAALNLAKIGLPQPFFSVLDILGGGALGLGLLTVGAGLRIGRISAQKGLVFAGTILRLLGMPLLMFSATWLFGVEGLPRTVAVIAAAVPTAAASYVLARQMGGDAPLMANLTTAQVLLAALTLPLMIWLTGFSA